VPGLEHFDQTRLVREFQKFEIPDSAGCDPDVEQCIKDTHMFAMRCIGLWLRNKGDKIRTCKQESEDIRNGEREWQTASMKWHQGLGKCLSGENPPTNAVDAVDDASDLFKRKKRYAQTASTVDDSATYTNPKQCWRAMKTKKDECKTKSMQCSLYVQCNGLGEEPTAETLKQWWTYMKNAREDKEAKVKAHMRALRTCLREEGQAAGEHSELDEN